MPGTSDKTPRTSIERERKFLVDTSLLPSLTTYQSSRIEQYYISVDGDKEIRIRRIGDEYVITHKHGGGAEREETEWSISADDFQWLRAAAKQPYVTKTRYFIPYCSRTIELDVYSGGLAGLVTAEVEFPTRGEMDAFVPPNWMATEVTDDDQFKNRNLAGLNIRRNAVIRPTAYGMLDGVQVAVERVREKASESLRGVVVVAVAGGSGSGKTSTVAQKIKDAFGNDAVMISADDYYHDKAYMEARNANGASLNWDSPEMVDTDSLRRDVAALKSGEPIWKPVYDHKTASVERHETVAPKHIIVVEGIFALNEGLGRVTDLKIFVESTEHSRLLRRLIRDVSRTALNSQQIARYFLGTVEPMHKKHVAPEIVNADIVIRNDYVPLIEGKKIAKHELQLKFVMPKGMESKLERLGAVPVATINQDDDYYSTADDGPGSHTELIRVRHEDGTSSLTYKVTGPDGSRYRIDAELDQETESQIPVIYERECIVSKKRRFYLLDGVLFSIDTVNRMSEGEVSRLGEFVEVRFHSAEAMRSNLQALKEKLGIESQEIAGSYSTIPAQAA